MNIYDNIGCSFEYIDNEIVITGPLPGYLTLVDSHVGSTIPYLARNINGVNIDFEVGTAHIAKNGTAILATNRVVSASSENNSRIDFSKAGTKQFYLFVNTTNFNTAFNNVEIENKDFSINLSKTVYIIDFDINKTIKAQLPPAPSAKNLEIEFKTLNNGNLIITDGTTAIELSGNNRYTKIVSTGQDWVELKDFSTEFKNQSTQTDIVYSTLSDPSGEDYSLQYKDNSSFSGSKVYWDPISSGLVFGGTFGTSGPEGGTADAKHIISTQSNYPVIFNQNRSGSDFIVHGTGNMPGYPAKNLYFSHTGKLGINIPAGSEPKTVLHIINTLCREGLRLENFSECYPADITLYQNSLIAPNNTNNDQTFAQITFAAKNSSSVKRNFAQIIAKRKSVSSSEGELQVLVGTSGSLSGLMTLKTNPYDTTILHQNNSLVVSTGSVLITSSESNIIVGSGIQFNGDVSINDNLKLNYVSSTNNLLSLDENKNIVVATGSALTGIYEYTWPYEPTDTYRIGGRDLQWERYKHRLINTTDCGDCLKDKLEFIELNVPPAEFVVGDTVAIQNNSNNTITYKSILETYINLSSVTGIRISGEIPLSGDISIYSVTRGGILTSKIYTDSTEFLTSGGQAPTSISLSTRPGTPTVFNTEKQNIDFIVLGTGNSSAFSIIARSGYPVAPTAPQGTSTKQIATTEFVTTAIATNAGLQGSQGAQGIQGFAGLQGRQGLQGVQGLQGNIGIQGHVGIQGNDGVQGIQGIQGLDGAYAGQGVQGLQGSQGIQGILGTSFNWKGVWNSSETYLENDIVLFNGNGNTYIAIFTNTNMPPSPDGAGTWQVFLPRGTQGVQGLQGVPGIGVQGLQGIQGLHGPSGLQGLQGIPGEYAAQGIQGLQGSQGVQGLQGIPGEYAAQGIQGLQGPSGLQGAQGLQGIPGEYAAQGIQGVQGAQGIQGFMGESFIWRSNWSFSEVYHTSHVVLYNNQLYISIIDNNIASIPSTLSDWDLYLPQSSQGLQGVQGLQGTQGLQGRQGLQGVIGSQGIQGNQGIQGGNGPQGLQGLSLNWKGEWQDIQYTLNDVVYYNGSAWISPLEDMNGSTPGIGNWELLASGTQGTQGLQGRQGLQGTAGEYAAQGIQGVQGSDGNQGLQGLQGRQGLQGLIGTQGIQGLNGQGFSFTGDWQTTTIYNNGNVTRYNNNLWIYQKPTPTFSGDPPPGTYPDLDGWYIYMPSIQGVQGLIGSQGLAGTGLVWRGAWTTVPTSWYQNDIVSYNGSIYICIVTHTYIGGDFVDTDTDHWQLFIAQDIGSQGIQGIQGLQGRQGLQGLGGSQGTQGVQGLQGRQGVQGLQGGQGIQGLQGVQGNSCDLSTEIVAGSGIVLAYNSINNSVSINVENWSASSIGSSYQYNTKTYNKNISNSNVNEIYVFDILSLVGSQNYNVKVNAYCPALHEAAAWDIKGLTKFNDQTCTIVGQNNVLSWKDNNFLNSYVDIISNNNSLVVVCSGMPNYETNIKITLFTF